MTSVLADENVPRAAVEVLRNAGMDVSSVSETMAGEVDLSALVGKGVFARWADPKEFEKVYIDEEAGTTAWPGDIDLAPDALYRDVAGQAAA